MTKKTLLASALMATTLAGCGDSESKLNLVPVVGTITFNGNDPLTDAEIVFIPANKEGKRAQDTTGPQGNYKLQTEGQFGAEPGLYDVLVTKAPPATSEALARHPGDPYMAKFTLASLDPSKGKKKEAAKEGGEIKEKFGREVLAKGAKFDFDIKVKVASAPATPKKKK